MKQIGFVLILLTASIEMFSQGNNLQAKLDSIINEADLLYRYEKSVWNSTDLLMADEKLKKKYGGYVVSHSGDTVLVTYLDKTQKEGIARFTYISKNLDKPFNTNLESSPLTLLEKELLEIKIKIINQFSDSKYNVTIPQGYNPNLVLIKSVNDFKLYILMGTSESGVIPFGNDYLFRTGRSGTITEWKKFHSRMIPAYSKGPNGEKVVSAIHSHLKTTPYITATDICTFRLYGEFCGMEEFMVLCTATDKYYRYNRKTNTIEITEP
jgi:hypothetical protein